MINYQNIIKINPEKRFGKPCVRETRISVYDVLGWLSTGMTFKEIIEDFPELTIEDIKACLSLKVWDSKEYKMLTMEEVEKRL